MPPEQPQLPESCVEHQPKYQSGAWRGYSLAELGNAVAFFAKRATHRMDSEKRRKDLTDAQNYLHFMQAHIDFLVEDLL